MNFDYALLKVIHVGCVALSGAGFAARGILMLAQSPMLQLRWVRVSPHVVDSLLLLSAIGLAWLGHLSPFDQPWLATKIVALLIYVALGMVALRGGRTVQVRAVAFFAALATYSYIVGVALTRDPIPWSS